MTPAQPRPEALPLPPNPTANKALIAGLLSVIPGVGLAAIVLGLMAGQRARLTGGSGRGRALLAIVLGLSSLLMWTMFVGAFFQYRAMKYYAIPADKATRQFIMLVGSGNVAAAKGLCTDAIDLDRLTDTAVEFDRLGNFVGDLTDGGGRFLGSWASGPYEINYVLPFATGPRRIVCDWVFVDGRPRLAEYRLIEVTTTQPATQAAAK